MTTSKSRGGEYTRTTVRLAQGMGIILPHCRDMKTEQSFILPHGKYDGAASVCGKEGIGQRSDDTDVHS